MLINETTITSSDSNQPTIHLNPKYRHDDLRVFISGLKKTLYDILFFSRTDDIASAMHQRCDFAKTFAKT